MKDFRRLVRYVRPYFGRLIAAAACSVFVSLVYLGLLGLIQPILELLFPGATTLPGTAAGKLRPFDHLKRLFGSGGPASPGPPAPRWLADGTTGTIVPLAVLVVLPFL